MMNTTKQKKGKKRLVIIFALFLFINCNHINAAEYSASDAQRFSAYYSNGLQYLNDGQYTSAINEFKKVLRVSPYDTTIQEALANAYYKRAKYYRTQTKEIKKALVDLKSANFYAKYWSKDNSSQNPNLAQIATSSAKEINELEKRLNSSNDPSTILQNAKILKAQGELSASGYDFQKLLNTQYKNTAYENLSNIYKNLNNLALAMDYIKTAIDNEPNNAKLHFLYGVMLDSAKNYEASMEQYNLALQYGDKSPELMEILENKWTQGVANNPNSAQGYINLGAIYQKQGNLEGAKAQYQKAYQLNPNDEVILYNLASLYVQEKNYLEANKIYDKILALNPNKTDVLKYKAQILEDEKNYDEALKIYERILTLEPNNADIKQKSENIILNNFQGEKLKNYLVQKANTSLNNYEAQFNCALEFHKNKDYKNAIYYYQKAQKLNPAKEETYINLAQIYIEQKEYKKAMDICQKGLIVLPNSAQLSASLNDAKNYSLSSQYIEASKLYDQKNYPMALKAYLNIENKTNDVKMAIASCYWQMKDYKNASLYYEDVIKTEPNNLEALVNLTTMYYSLNDFTNAKMSANKVLALDKTNKDALSIISNIEENENSNILNDAIQKYENASYDESLAILNKYLQTKPDDEFALYYKALNLDELKKPNDAVKQYKLLISKNPNFENAYYSLGLNYDNSQKYELAVENYEKYLSLKNNAQDETTNFAKNRIKELKDYLNELNGSKK